MKTFEEMNRAELTDSIKRLGLEDRLKEKATELHKTVNTLKNSDVLGVLNEFKDEQDGKTADADKAGNQEKVEINKRPIDEVRQEFNDLRQLVIVTDHNNKFSPEEDIAGRVVEVNVGNNVIGRVTHRVKLDGQPQLLSHAIIRKLKNIDSYATVTDNKTKNAGTTKKKRFSVAPAGELSKEQIEQMAKEQEARKGLNL